MRLPFGFGRRSGSETGARGGDTPAGSTSTAGAQTSESGSLPAVVPGSSPSAWASLAPIQRTLGDMPLVAAPGAFADALPGSHGLPPIVQPLGHDVSPLATPGLVVAHARPVAASTGGALPAPVQRSRRGAHAEVATSPPVPTGDGDEAPIDRSPASGSVPTAPIRSLPTVSRMTIRMPDRPLTSAASAARPASVQRTANGAGAGTPTPVAHTGMRRTPVPGSTPAAPVVSRKAPSPTAATTSPVTPMTSAPTLPTSPASPPRTGLGAPLDVLPSSARPVGPSPANAVVTVPVSRQIATSALPLAPVGRRSAVQRDASGPPAAPAAPVAAPIAPDPPVRQATTLDLPALPVLPVLPVARSTQVRPSEPAPGLAPASTAAPAPVVRPILGARPMEPTIHLQRSTAPDDADADDDAMLPSPWWAPSGSGDTQQGPTAAAAVAASPMVVSRSVPGDGQDPPPIRAGLTTPAAIALSPTAPSSRRTVQRATAGPAALPLARPIAPAPGRQTAAPVAQPSDQPLPGQRLLGAGPAAEIVVQTSPAGTAGHVAGSWTPPAGGAPVVQRAGSEGPRTTRGPAAPARSETDLEELAQALFGRIRGRLRSELIHDREAKGLSFDNV